jgi:chromosome partitioning protein|tara:strand:- start:111 stop:743 length:633 start_codon:yes stop_codon:yes gene_type:complete
MGKIIAFSNQKGGSGKTTLSANLAVLWANSDYKVAVIDADAQQSLTYWLNARKKYYGTDPTGIDFFSFNPRNLKENLNQIKKKYDFIIIDSPPAITFETIQIIKSSDAIFVPVQPSPLDLMATIPFINIARDERKKTTVILNRVMPRAKLTEAMILRLRYAGAKIARSRVSGKIIYAETFTVGRGVVDISVTSEASKEIINLGNEILRII